MASDLLLLVHGRVPFRCTTRLSSLRYVLLSLTGVLFGFVPFVILPQTSNHLPVPASPRATSGTICLHHTTLPLSPKHDPPAPPTPTRTRFLDSSASWLLMIGSFLCLPNITCIQLQAEFIEFTAISETLLSAQRLSSLSDLQPASISILSRPLDRPTTLTL